MKIKIKETCKDKYSGEEYAKGTIIEAEDERGQEIVEAHGGIFAEEVKKGDKPAKDSKDKKKGESEDDKPEE